MEKHRGTLPAAGLGRLCQPVLLMGSVIVLATMFTQPEIAHASKDEPLGNATAPRLLYLSSGVGSNHIGAVSGPGRGRGVY